MNDMCSRNDLRNDEKAKRCFQLQNRYLAFKEQLNTRTQAAISQKPDKESLTPPPPLNPTFLTPPPTVETSSQQGPKRNIRRIQFVNYLEGKQLRHKKFKPNKYSMGEEDED